MLALIASVLLGVNVDSYRYAVAAGGSSYFCDDFNRADSTTVTGWTEDVGDWIVTSNQLTGTSTGSWERIRYTTTQADGADQFAKLQLSSQGFYFGFTFRVTSPTGTFYTVLFDPVAGTVLWRKNTGSTEDETVQSGTFASAVASGDYVGATVVGSGASTVVTVWHWTSDPGLSIASWGSTDKLTFTNNPTVAVDSGGYLGLLNYFNNDLLDNFCGGDTSDAP